MRGILSLRICRIEPTCVSVFVRECNMTHTHTRSVYVCVCMSGVKYAYLCARPSGTVHTCVRSSAFAVSVPWGRVRRR